MWPAWKTACYTHAASLSYPAACVSISRAKKTPQTSNADAADEWQTVGVFLCLYYFMLPLWGSIVSSLEATHPWIQKAISLHALWEDITEIWLQTFQQTLIPTVWSGWSHSVNIVHVQPCVVRVDHMLLFVYSGSWIVNVKAVDLVVHRDPCYHEEHLRLTSFDHEVPCTSHLGLMWMFKVFAYSVVQ